MECKHCKGSGAVISKHGGIGLRNGVWHTYAAPVTCWHCQGTGTSTTETVDVRT